MILIYEKGRGDKIHISVDGDYAFTVDSLFWYGLGIKNNSEIDDEKLAELKHSVSSRCAFNKAIDLLSRREHSRKEIVTKLDQRGFRDVSEETAELLVEKGYIDDERFAKMYASELKERKYMGKRRIAQELFLKGIDRDTVYGVLEAMPDSVDDEIRTVTERKYSRALGDEKGYRRAVNGLMRLGYSYDDIKRVLSEITEERNERI